MVSFAFGQSLQDTNEEEEEEELNEQQGNKVLV
jgi:hypothetical protein